MPEKTADNTVNVIDNEKMRAKSYLESKLSLYSNLRGHFDSVSELLDILIEYMQYSIDQTTRSHFKKRLVRAGVFNNEQILEFLLLISEKVRHFQVNQKILSDEQLCRYYFDQYKSSTEQWPQTDFPFLQQHTQPTTREAINS